MPNEHVIAELKSACADCLCNMRMINDLCPVHGSGNVVSVVLNERELEWIRVYAREQQLTENAAVRQAVRVLSLVHDTPGAWEFLREKSRIAMGPLS